MMDMIPDWFAIITTITIIVLGQLSRMGIFPKVKYVRLCNQSRSMMISHIGINNQPMHLDNDRKLVQVYSSLVKIQSKKVWG